MSSQYPAPPPGDSDLERELGAAMADYARSVDAPVYQAADFGRRARPRGAWFALAAAVALVAVSAGFVLTGHASRRTGPAGPTPAFSTAPAPGPWTVSQHPSSSPPSPPTTPTTATSTSSPNLQTSATPPSSAVVLRRLFGAAELSASPATRSLVDRQAVAELFADPETYARFWGADGIRTTCGLPVDGVLVDGTTAYLFEGPNAMAQRAEVGLDGRGRVLDITCVANTPSEKGVDPVALYFGGLVQADAIGDAASRRAAVVALEKYLEASLRSGDGSGVTCGPTRPRTWVADTPTAGTTTWGWTVTLDGGRPFFVDYGSSDPNGATGNLMTAASCPVG